LKAKTQARKIQARPTSISLLVLGLQGLPKMYPKPCLVKDITDLYTIEKGSPNICSHFVFFKKICPK
jgi:hypothetical protein